MRNNLKTVTWLNELSSNKLLHRYLSIVLLIVIMSFFLIDSSKIRNNIFYLFFIFPTLTIFLSNSLRGKSFKVSTSFNFLLFYFLCGFSATIFSENEPLSFFRHFLCILMLYYGFKLCTKDENICKFTGITYVIICFFVMLISFYYWQDIYFSTGNFPRVTLYAAASNPIHASLMILFGWLAFWIIYGLPKLLTIGRLPYLFGFLLMQSLALFTCIIFQSRSGLLGLFAVTAAWFMLGKERKFTFFLILALIFAFYFTGNYEAFLNRGLSYRLDIWQNVLLQINNTSSWLTGIKQEGEILYLGKFHHPHSAYLSILAHTGLVGLVSFFFFSCVYFIQGIRNRSPWFIISMLGWVALLVTSNGIVDSPHPLLIYFWIPTLLAILDYPKHLYD